MAKSFVVNGGGGSSNASTCYLPLGAHAYCSGTAPHTTEAAMEVPVRAACTIRNLFVNVTTGTGTGTVTFTLRKSQADTALSVAYTDTQSGVKEDLDDDIAFAATDECCLKMVGRVNGQNIRCWGVEIDPDTAGNTLQVASAQFNGGINHSFQNVNWWSRPTPATDGFLNSEAATQQTVDSAFTASNLYTYVTSNARTTDTVLRVRKNAGNGNQLITYTSGQTGVKEDTSNTDTFAALDEIDYMLTANSGTQTISFSVLSHTRISTDESWQVATACLVGDGMGTSATVYHAWGANLPSAQLAPDEDRAEYMAQFDFWAHKFRCYVYSNSTSADTTVTLRKDNGDTAASIAVAGGQTGWKEDLSDSIAYTAATNRGCFKIVTPASGSIAFGTIAFTAASVQPLVHYTLTAASGSYALSGQAATLKRSKLTAVAGSYALTGQAALLKRGLKIVAAQGSYALTGQAALLKRGLKLTAAQGSYALTGQAATLTRKITLTAAAGSYALTGSAADLRKSLSLTAVAGSYAVTGGDAGLRENELLSAATGSYALTGQAVTFKLGLRMVASSGSYALTGAATGLLEGTGLAATAGSYALTGNAADLREAEVLPAVAGAYSVAGSAAALSRAVPLAAASGSYALTGNTAGLVKSWKLTAVAGSYVLTGSDATLMFGNMLGATAGAYALTGSDAALSRTKKLLTESGSYGLTGNPADLMAGEMISAVSGAYSLTGQSATLSLTKRLMADAGAYLLTGRPATLIDSAAGTFPATGEYLLSGNAATLKMGHALAAPAGSYTITPGYTGLIASNAPVKLWWRQA